MELSSPRVNCNTMLLPYDNQINIPPTMIIIAPIIATPIFLERVVLNLLIKRYKPNTTSAMITVRVKVTYTPTSKSNDIANIVFFPYSSLKSYSSKLLINSFILKLLQFEDRP